MEIIKLNIIDIRKNKQKKNNTIVANYLLKYNLNWEDFSKVINKKELERILFELNWNFEQFHKKCLDDEAFCIVVSGRISKLASRQGVADELFILHSINKYTKRLGVFVKKPEKELIVFNNEIKVKKKLNKETLFRSIDGIISGKLTGFIFCKIILGKGSTQMNSWNEAKNLIKWAIESKFKDNLIFLIDTDDLFMFKELKNLVLFYINIQVFSHIHFQEWVKNSIK